MRFNIKPVLLAEAHEYWGPLLPRNPERKRRSLAPAAIRIHHSYAAEYARRSGAGSRVTA